MNQYDAPPPPDYYGRPAGHSTAASCLGGQGENAFRAPDAYDGSYRDAATQMWQRSSAPAEPRHHADIRTAFTTPARLEQEMPVQDEGAWSTNGGSDLAPVALERCAYR